MSSELVPDLLNGLVAVGTIGLAVATYSVARLTRRAGIDAAAHRIVVTTFYVEGQLLTDAAVARVSPPVAAGTPWDLTQYGDTKIGLRAVAHVRNEGIATARFQFTHEDQVEIEGVTGPRIFNSRPLTNGPVTEQGGWYLIPPGGEATAVLIWWLPASEWGKSWQSRVRNNEAVQPPPTTRLQLAVRGAVAGGAADECHLQFGAYVVVQNPSRDGWVIADNDPESRAACKAPHPPIASVDLIRRSYPREP